jgi:flavin-dependent dehydrogenase
MQLQTAVLVIGGGLSGLTTALHLNKAGLHVIVIEKDAYPHHKVCGEYISNEVLPYFEWLNLSMATLGSTQLKKLAISTNASEPLEIDLPLGGFGVSRYALDHYLYRTFIERGGMVIHDSVTDVRFENDLFTVVTKSGQIYTARQVIGAYGKRAALDVRLDRKFMKEKHPYLAVKAHYDGDFPDDVVALHNFTGGYCGVSKVEGKKINICYLANYETFKSFKSLDAYQKQVLYKNKNLAKIFENSRMTFEQPLTISQLSFGTKETVVNHMLMIGDTAALIHPLCGNGMAMAVHSAKICAENLIEFINSKIADRQQLEEKYQHAWNKQFRGRLRTANFLSNLLKKEKTSALMLRGLTAMPFLLKQIIRRTHGKPILKKT